MRRILLLVTAALAATAVPAAAQTRIVNALQVTPPPATGRFVGGGRVNKANIGTRIWSYDVDGDDRVASAELPERMQSVMERGDADRDGYLTTEEVDRLVSLAASGAPRPQGFSMANKRLSFAEVVGDLRLPQPKHEMAMKIATSYSVPRNINSSESLDLREVYDRMRRLLDDEEYENFVAAAARHGSGAPTGNVVLPARR